MTHDGHATGDPEAAPGTPADARTDHWLTRCARRPGPGSRSSAGRPFDRSVETTPQALYLWQIAVLEARLDVEEARAERAERDRQYVIDRYEKLLEERASGELYTDGGRAMDREQSTAQTVTERAIERVRSLL
ncbi:MAG: hypothetical protein V5A44_04475 [Haloarculaceae archaeon]